MYACALHLDLISVEIRKRALDLRGLGLPMVVNQIWVLGIEPISSGRADVSTLNH